MKEEAEDDSVEVRSGRDFIHISPVIMNTYPNWKIMHGIQPATPKTDKKALQEYEFHGPLITTTCTLRLLSKLRVNTSCTVEDEATSSK